MNAIICISNQFYLLYVVFPVIQKGLWYPRTQPHRWEVSYLPLFMHRMFLFFTETIRVMLHSSLRDGNLQDIVNRGSLHEFLVSLHQEFGSVASFWFGGRPVVSLGSVNQLRQHINPNHTSKATSPTWRHRLFSYTFRVVPFYAFCF